MMSQTTEAPKMLKCSINGVELEVKPGTSIIQAMFDNQQRIAHYCWHPGLSIAGVCRLCMVEIEGNPRLQIACNTQVTEGMKINNTSPKVIEATKWGLDFHLINHPLDCPVCDQAGECGLQDQYMEFGKYTSEMAEKKQKKHKVVDLGPTVVLDSERCILCSRCVRFTDEVSKTNELGIFSRGDHAEIGTHDGKELNNKYSLNTVDICPVGALTSKDFRFKQRVWYLKDSETVCNGCSTGCSVKVYFNKDGVFRVKPKFNEPVNGHWMCDDGRNIYKFANQDARQLKAISITNTSGRTVAELSAGQLVKDLSAQLKSAKPEEIAMVVTGQLTNEELTAVVGGFVSTFKSKQIFNWWPFESKASEFDGLLIRGDKNPNSRGLAHVFSAQGISTKWSDLESLIQSRKIKHLVVFGPENTLVYNDILEKNKVFTQVENLVYFASAKMTELEASAPRTGQSISIIPMKTYVEKNGSFTNHAGVTQNFKRVTTIVSHALNGIEAIELLQGQELKIEVLPAKALMTPTNQRPDQVQMEHRKKNEFIFQRGRL